MSARYEMGSLQWLAALHACFAAERPRVQISRDASVCEVYRDVLASIPSADGVVAFTVRLKADSLEVDFEPRESHDTDFKVTFAYAAVLPIGRFVVGADPARQAELQAMVGRAVRDGKATMKGTSPEELRALGVHDLIARMTA